MTNYILNVTTTQNRNQIYIVFQSLGSEHYQFLL